jgi:hypothetical protein
MFNIKYSRRASTTIAFILCFACMVMHIFQRLLLNHGFTRFNQHLKFLHRVAWSKFCATIPAHDYISKVCLFDSVIQL